MPFHNICDTYRWQNIIWLTLTGSTTTRATIPTTFMSTGPETLAQTTTTALHMTNNTTIVMEEGHEISNILVVNKLFLMHEFMCTNNQINFMSLQLHLIQNLD